jgi:hypothetical protein
MATEKVVFDDYIAFELNVLYLIKLLLLIRNSDMTVILFSTM